MIRAFTLLELHIQKRYPAALLINLVNIFLHLSVFYFISESIGRTENFEKGYFSFVVLGLAFSRTFQTFADTALSRLYDWQYQGTLETLLTTPQPRWKLLLSAGLPSSVAALLNNGLLILMAAAVFQARWTEFRGFHVLAVILLTFVLCQALSLISITSILLWKRINLTKLATSLVALLLSGVYFPISVLPLPIQKLALLFPFTHAMHLFRWAFHANADASHPQFSYLVLIGWTVSLVIAAAAFFSVAERKLMDNGKLSTI